MSKIEYPVVTLSNGIKVANFSSPHTFLFEDGNILPACSKERAEWLMLDSEEIEYDGLLPYSTDIELIYRMNAVVRDELMKMSILFDQENTIIIVPFPVLMALKAEHGEIRDLPIRTLRLKDRVERVHYINKFCL